MINFWMQYGMRIFPTAIQVFIGQTTPWTVYYIHFGTNNVYRSIFPLVFFLPNIIQIECKYQRPNIALAFIIIINLFDI